MTLSASATAGAFYIACPSAELIRQRSAPARSCVPRHCVAMPATRGSPVSKSCPSSTISGASTACRRSHALWSRSTFSGSSSSLATRLVCTRLRLVGPELLDWLARVAVDFALHGAGGLVDHVHGRLLSAGIATLVAKLRAQLAATIVGSATFVPPTTIERLIVEESNLFHVRADTVGNFFAQSFVEGVDMHAVV